MARVKDKVAVVTGGAQGIDRATCLLLSKEGSRVAVTDVLDKEGVKWLTISSLMEGKQGTGIWMFLMRER